MSAPSTVLVVGAGLSGLLAGAAVADLGAVTVLEKSRGVGGRLATRRVGDAVYDHGAQFFTAPSTSFAPIVQRWREAGVAVPWFEERLEPDGSTVPDGHVRWRGAPGMSALARHEADGLAVRTGARVTSLALDDRLWRATLDDGATLGADAVVLSAPVPQSLALLDAGGVALDGAQRRALDAVAYDRCLAVLASLGAPSGMASPGALRPAREPLDWIADNQLKGVSPVPALTLHAAPAFSLAHWGDGDDEVVDLLLAALPLTERPEVLGAEVQRWRFSKPTALHPDRFVAARGLPPLVFCGDAFGGARVEGAALSGMAAGAHLRALLAEGSR